MAIPCKSFSAVQIWFAAGQTSGVNALTTTGYANIAVLPDGTDGSIVAAVYSQLSVGPAPCTSVASPFTLLPSPDQNRRTYACSAWVPIKSVARTDGGAFPLLVVNVSAYQSTGANGNIINSGNGTDSFTNWETIPNGRTWRMRIKTGEFAQNSTLARNMTAAGTIAASGTPILGAKYVCDGKVVSLVSFGDSNFDGRATYLGEGFGGASAAALQTDGGGITYDYTNLAWSGQTSAQSYQDVLDALAAGLRWNVALIGNGSLNDVSGNTITAANITTWQLNTGQSTLALNSAGIPTITNTVGPRNTAVNAYGATDALRVNENTRWAATSTIGNIVVDTNTVWSGLTDGAGQVQWKVPYTSDGVHYNQAGQTAVIAGYSAAVRRAVQISAGLLARIHDRWDAAGNDDEELYHAA